MIRTRTVALTAAGLLAAAGLSTAASPSTAAEATAWVTGTVVDGDGDPVAGALVVALPPRRIPDGGVLDESAETWTTTAADGSFRLRQAAPGFLVQVCDQDEERPWACAELSRAGYLAQYVGPDGGFDSWVQHTRLYDASPADLELGTVTVRPGATVHGTVEGAANERIRLMRLNDTMAYSTFSDADGAYSLSGMAPGTYYVAAGGFGTLPWRSEPVTLDAAQPVQVDGVLDEGAAVTGRLVDARTGEPAARTDVFLAGADGDLVASRGTSRTGRFRFTGLAPGGYRVGMPFVGGDYLPHTEPVTVADGDTSVTVEVGLRRGATVTVPFRGGDGRLGDELRDADGDVIETQRGRDGSATYTGLRPGTYTVVAADDDGYGLRTFRVRGHGEHTMRPLPLDRELLTIHGRTAPGAVVEATTGDLCPPDGEPTYGGFHAISDPADATGRYVLEGLVPGRLMVAADGFPHNYAPICHEDVEISASRRYDVPLAPGHTVTGRMVYAGTDLPVVTTLGYELSYPAGQVTNPTEEHPSLARTRGASGVFTIDRLPVGPVTGDLASESHEGITHPSFITYFPFQDGTPYWLESAARAIDVQGDVDLGDVELTLGGTTPAE
ncbi:MAG TPA: carboxypeptidase-like regulatory domain-containing protein [Nocardioides sp.]|nr:carboxypeptidase-like regulatory domain-containing protein [Nocardioides sp.]